MCAVMPHPYTPFDLTFVVHCVIEMDMHMVHPCIFSWHRQGKLYCYSYFPLLCLSLILKI